MILPRLPGNRTSLSNLCRSFRIGGPRTKQRQLSNEFPSRVQKPFYYFVYFSFLSNASLRVRDTTVRKSVEREPTRKSRRIVKIDKGCTTELDPLRSRRENTTIFTFYLCVCVCVCVCVCIDVISSQVEQESIGRGKKYPFPRGTHQSNFPSLLCSYLPPCWRFFPRTCATRRQRRRGELKREKRFPAGTFDRPKVFPDGSGRLESIHET